MMCRTGTLAPPASKQRGFSPPNRTETLSSDNSKPQPRARHEEFSETKAREFVWKPTVKIIELDYGFSSEGSSGTSDLRSRMNKAIVDNFSFVSDPVLALVGEGIDKSKPDLVIADSTDTETTESSDVSSGISSVVSLMDSPGLEPLRGVEDWSVASEQEDTFFEGDHAEESPEFDACFPRSLNLFESASFDVMTHASDDDCGQSVNDEATTNEEEAFQGDRRSCMHAEELPPADPNQRKQSKYNKYRDLQAPTRTLYRGLQAPTRTFCKPFKISPQRSVENKSIEEKNEEWYEKLDQRLQKLLVGNRKDIETLHLHLDEVKTSTKAGCIN
jgi:hypothetical protein